MHCKGLVKCCVVVRVTTNMVVQIPTFILIYKSNSKCFYDIFWKSDRNYGKFLVWCRLPSSSCIFLPHMFYRLFYYKWNGCGNSPQTSISHVTTTAKADQKRVYVLQIQLCIFTFHFLKQDKHKNIQKTSPRWDGTRCCISCTLDLSYVPCYLCSEAGSSLKVSYVLTIWWAHLSWPFVGILKLSDFF